MKDNVEIGYPARLAYHLLEERKKRVTLVFLFLAICLLAITPPYSCLVIYSVTCTVTCPLIATVLPGLFYYRVSKADSDLEQAAQKRQSAFGFGYFLLNLAVLPFYLMLTMYAI